MRAVTRSPNTARLPADVEVVTSVADALPGASAVFLNSRPLGDRLADVVARCRFAGITKLVALSAINADDDDALQPSRFRGDRNREVEHLAEGSGLAWPGQACARRCSRRISPACGRRNCAPATWLPDPTRRPPGTHRRSRRLRGCGARAADRRTGRAETLLTGPQALTNAELVEVIGSVLGRPVQYREMPPDVVRARFRDLGFAPEFANAYIAMLAQTLDKPALVTHEVEKILGRPPLTFAQWVSDQRHAFTRGARDV